MSPPLDDIAYRAQAHPQAVFTALAHHLTPEFLEETWQHLNRQGAPGLSGETMEAYGRVRSPRIRALVETLQARAYRVPPVRRVYIFRNPDSRPNRGLWASPKWKTACCKRRR